MNRQEPPRLTTMCPQLLVSDLERSISFYAAELGFSVDFRFEDFYAGVSRDGHTIHLKLGNPSPEERNNRRANEHLDITFGASRIDAIFAEFSARNVEFTQPLRTMHYGREFYVSDPDGYILGFLELSEKPAD